MYLCMRTTVDLEDHLLRLARRKAAEEGRTLTAVIEEALRVLLHRPPRTRRPFHLQWVTRRGTKAPALDIADRDALYERLSGRR
jgi:hypothetical protein